MGAAGSSCVPGILAGTIGRTDPVASSHYVEKNACDNTRMVEHQPKESECDVGENRYYAKPHRLGAIRFSTDGTNELYISSSTTSL